MELRHCSRLHTVNQVPAHGGSIGSIGPTIAGGMVFIGSGYSVTSGIPGNVLLAFAAVMAEAARTAAFEAGLRQGK